MEGFDYKDKKKFILYEFLGTALVTFVTNFSAQSVPGVMFLVSIWAWELSAAHFNCAITLGSAILDNNPMGSKVKGFLTILFSQFVGALVGILLSFISSKYDYVGKDNLKNVTPKVPTLCPLYTDPNGSGKNGCLAENINWDVFASEFIASFILVLSWLIIRNYSFRGDLEKAQNIIKPVFVYLAYGTCQVLVSLFSRGPTNPTMAIQLGIWGKSAYNDVIVDPVTGGNISIWAMKGFGRFLWVYTFAPLGAGFLAGLVAKFHFRDTDDEQMPRKNSNSDE